MTDWAGLTFLVLLLFGVLAGLRRLANPPARTAEDFERSVSESGAVVGAIGSGLQGLLQPQFARARIVVAQMNDGRYQKKRREGKASDDSGEQFSVNSSGGSDI